MEYVIFELNNENYAVALDKIKEILVYSQVIITELFSEEIWVKGLINLRGEVIPIFDLRLLFGIEDAKFSENTVIIVVKTSEDKLIGLIVDDIKSILELDQKNFSPAPEIGVSIEPRYIEGLIKLSNNQMTTVLNIDAVLKLEEMIEE
ncbi:MAG: chemotaxis protein CheW [Sulfurospirillum sp.]|nr:MAG: chemotaxis protein CheW [Sulfurospirillum sp.]